MVKKNSQIVVVKLQGGLGNNLFQYAAGKYLALKTNASLVLDLSIIDFGLTHHGYYLRYMFQDFREINKSENFVISKKLHNLFSRLIAKCAKKFVFIRIIFTKLFNKFYSNEIGLDEQIEQLKPPILIQGYFQTWKHVENLILSNNFTLNLFLKSKWLLEMEKIAMNIRPVVVHIRRGDYDLMNDEFGMLSTEYYFKALDQLPTELINKELWIFSDDIVIAKKMFKEYKQRKKNFISMPLVSNPAEIMYLMSLGSGHIIANSTFSYWGAYLSKNSKIIIAPDKWFKTWEDPKDLINPRWIRVKSDWE